MIKIGDRIKFVGASSTIPFGHSGVVTKVWPTEFPRGHILTVTFDPTGDEVFDECLDGWTIFPGEYV